MRLLLDTPALMRWLLGDEALPPQAREAIADPDNEIFVSAASAWEIAARYRLGQMPEAAFLSADMAGIVAGQGFSELPVSIRDAQLAGGLPAGPADPFVRLLAAQAVAGGLAVISDNPAFDSYGVTRLR